MSNNLEPITTPARRAFVLCTFLCFLTLTALFVVAVQARAQGGQRESLTGIKKIYVYVSEIPVDVENAGLRTADIVTDAELRLRKIGIIVTNDHSDAMLNITCGIVQDNEAPEVFIFGITIHLDQSVQIPRRPGRLFTAATWTQGRAGVVGKQNLRAVRDNIGELVDKFINDYLAVNPKR